MGQPARAPMFFETERRVSPGLVQGGLQVQPAPVGPLTEVGSSFSRAPSRASTRYRDPVPRSPFGFGHDLVTAKPRGLGTGLAAQVAGGLSTGE